MLSIILLAAAISLLDRIQHQRAKTPISNLIQLHTGLTFIVLVAGTLVTGAGPHAGDVSAPRLNLHIPTISALHGGLVVALLVLSLYLFTNPAIARRWLGVFIGIALAQGVLGYAQYLLGVPQIMVAAHLIGAAVLWGSAWQLRISQRPIHNQRN